LTSDIAAREVIYWKSWVAKPGVNPPVDSSRSLVAKVLGERWADGSGPIRFLISFSKPMRDAVDGLDPIKAEIVGSFLDTRFIDLVNDPKARKEWLKGPKLLAVTQAAGFITDLGPARYEFDTWQVEFPAPDDMTVSSAGNKADLRIEAEDQVLLKLDGRGDERRR
jgi:hypothetical protein